MKHRRVPGTYGSWPRSRGKAKPQKQRQQRAKPTPTVGSKVPVFQPGDLAKLLRLRGKER